MYICIPVTSNYISSFMMSYGFSYNNENHTGLMSSYFNGNYIIALKKFEISTRGTKSDGVLTIENYQIKIFWAYSYRPDNDDLFHCCYTYYRWSTLTPKCVAIQVKSSGSSPTLQSKSVTPSSNT